MINISELLKNAPNGMKLYSPLFGEVVLTWIDTSDFPITVEDSKGLYRGFDEYGRYFNKYADGECLLFPSKDCRTWEGWSLPVEHNFKVHDWVVGDNQTAIIYDLQKECYVGKDVNGKDFVCRYADEDKLRLWTIQDAKDGDVLATRTIICVFRKLDKDGDYIVSPCIYTVGGGFEVINDENDTIGLCGFKPATKEDRDLLFRKMQEEGYAWDAEKKELRKTNVHYDISNFKPFDKVLVRDTKNERWFNTHYGFYDASAKQFVCEADTEWNMCIPFGGNEHLLGTTDPCDKCYVNW